ncbi:MAG TPA: cyclase family protein [Thermoanaerobaculia bacterium]|jgi:kynurenine formamidase|nr:cyclase family protein [Thermoanaerobaculia bacterium]
MTRELIDLSHDIEHGMITFPGLEGPVISDRLSRADSAAVYRGEAEFHIARIEMIANTGTYVDAPSHRDADGADIAQLPLEQLVFLPGTLVHLQERALRVEHVGQLDLRGRALLVHTGWSRHWRTETYGDRSRSTYVSREAAEHLARSGVALVGIDSVNIDDMEDYSRPAHTLLLRAAIPIVEHLTNLEVLGDRAFTFFAVPPRVRGVGTFPVRAFASVKT